MKSKNPNALTAYICEMIKVKKLWRSNEKVTVAVSGGIDSVTLLDLLVSTQKCHQAQLSVVTIDHGTRASSKDDARFVLELAKSYKLRCYIFTLDLGPNSSEQTCRDARYDCFKQLDVDKIALAHHQTDQAETVLMNLMRGSGVTGLSAMPWKRDIYVRPLLALPKTEIIKWVKFKGLQYRDDPTNLSPRFFRNRIRHEVLPLLEEIRSGSTKTIARSAQLASSDLLELKKLRGTLA